MKITYLTTAELNTEQLFMLLKESVEKKTGKHLANIQWTPTRDGMTCVLAFCAETAELADAPRPA